jgi:hypothetical protein
MTATNLDALLDANPELALRVERIEQWRDITWREMEAAWQRADDGRVAKRRADDDLAELRQHHERGELVVERRGGFNAFGMQEITREPDTARIERAERAATAAAERYARARAAHDAKAAEWTAASSLQAACERYLGALDRVEPTPWKAPSVPGADALAAIERVRADVASTAQLLYSTQTAPPPAADIKRKIRAQVKAVADGAPALIVGPDGVRQWPTTTVGSRPAPDAFALLAMMFPDQLAALAEGRVVEAENAIGDRERAAAVKKLSDRLLALQRDEEAIIRASEERGQDIARRGDADPRAVLGISGPPPRD